MPVISVPQAFNEEDLYVDLRAIIGHSLFLKCEGFNFMRLHQDEGRPRDGGGRRAGWSSEAGFDPGRVLVREPRRGAEHDRGEQGLSVPVRDGLPRQPVDQDDDGGPGQPGAHDRRSAGEQRRLSRRADRVRACAVRLRRPVCVAQSVHQPEQLEGALPQDGAGDRPSVPAAGRAVRRCRHHRHPDGLRALLPGVAPAGAGRRGGQRGLGVLRRSARPPNDSGPRDEHAPAAARRVLRGRSDTGRGEGHRPYLPPAGQERVRVRRLHRHGGQRRVGLVEPATTHANSPPWPSVRTSASATSTPSTRPAGCGISTATTCSTPKRSPPNPGGPPPRLRHGGAGWTTSRTASATRANALSSRTVRARARLRGWAGSGTCRAPRPGPPTAGGTSTNSAATGFGCATRGGMGGTGAKY